MDEEVLNPSERTVAPKSPESASRPTRNADPTIHRAGMDPAVHDPGMARSLEAAPTEPMDLAMNPGETAAEPLPRDRNHRRPITNHAGRADWRRHDAAGRRGCGGGGGGGRESSSAIHGRRSFPADQAPCARRHRAGVGGAGLRASARRGAQGHPAEVRRACRSAWRVSSSRPRSRANWSTRESYRCTVWAAMRTDGRTMRCGLSAARAYRPRSSDFTRPAGRRPNRRASAVDVGRRVPAVARQLPRRLRHDRLRP